MVNRPQLAIHGSGNDFLGAVVVQICHCQLCIEGSRQLNRKAADQLILIIQGINLLIMRCGNDFAESVVVQICNYWREKQSAARVVIYIVYSSCVLMGQGIDLSCPACEGVSVYGSID